MGTKSIDRDDSKRLMVFAGTSSKALGARIADRLGIELGDVQINRFQDGEVYVRFVFGSDDTEASGGWYVDNIEILGTPR